MLSVKTLAQLMLSFGAMSNKKIQKICYYAYSWYLTLYGRHLAPLQFEAWVHGPVSRELYHCYKKYGWEDIPQFHGFIMVDNETIAFARKVWEKYGGYSADELENMSHHELPWQTAREGCKYYESSDTLLDDKDIQAYFSQHIDEFQMRNDKVYS